MTDAITDAIALLRQRREQAVTEVGRLQGEISRIDGALASLGDVVKPQHASSSADDVAGKRNNLTEAVLECIDSADKWWSIDDLASSLRLLQGSRSDEQLRGTIRTALWSLRKRGQIISNGHGRHKARRYVADPTDTSAPDDTGAEVGEATTATGGDANGQAESHGDSPSRWNRDDRGGTSVTEGSLA